jgi:hypothetical protein
VEASRRVAAVLLDQAERVAREPGFGHEEPDVSREIPLADVRQSVERYVSQELALAGRDLLTPVLFSREGAVAPIDIGLPSLSAEQRAYLNGHYPDDLVSVLLDLTLAATSGSAVDRLGREQSRELVKVRLGEFLAARVDNSGGQSGDSYSDLSYAPPGYPFTVTTSTAKRRIHYSPAYFINKSLVFGGALSTVTGYLNPGRYTFGAYSTADGSNLWDGAEYDVPHVTSSAHIGF